MIIVIESSFVSAQVHTIDVARSIPQTPRGIKFVNLHKDIPRKVNRVFIKPLDPRKTGSNPPRPLGPPRYFGLPMANPSRPPLPPNKPYR